MPSPACSTAPSTTRAGCASEMMFEVAYADGGLTEFEDNLVSRAAELLNVGSRDRVRIRREVREEAEGDSGPRRN